MSDNDSFVNQFSNETIFSLMEKYKGIPDTFCNLFEIQVENMKSIGEMQKSSLKDMQKIASRHHDVFSQIMKNATNLANDMIENPDPTAALKASVDNIQKSYDATIESVNEVSDLLRSSGIKTNSILRDNAKQSLSEIQNVQKAVNDAS